VRKISVRFLENALSFIVEFADIKMGFAANECEQMGVIQMLCISGSIIGPPADME
jgi:hypothetical protein